MEGEFSEKATRWESNVSARLAKARPDQIWPLFSDFFNIHKWFPGLSACHGIHGVNGEVGSIRYSCGTGVAELGDLGQVLLWAKERLIGIDHVERRLTYEIVDTNFGFKSYVATFKVNPSGRGGGGEGEDGCTIEWSFGADRPLEGLKSEDLVSIYQNWLNILSKNMEDDVSASTQESTEDEKKSKNPKKWEARVSTTLSKATPDQIFPLFKDFFKPICYGIHGDNGELGCIRYCAGSRIPSIGDNQEEFKMPNTSS